MNEIDAAEPDTTPDPDEIVDLADVELNIPALEQTTCWRDSPPAISGQDLRKLSTLIHQGARRVLVPELGRLLRLGYIKQIRGGFIATEFGIAAYNMQAASGEAQRFVAPAATTDRGLSIAAAIAA